MAVHVDLWILLSFVFSLYIFNKQFTVNPCHLKNRKNARVGCSEYKFNVISFSLSDSFEKRFQKKSVRNRN